MISEVDEIRAKVAEPAVPDGVSRVRPKLCILGAGSHFLGGLSYYTHRLAHALDERNDVSVVLMRRLLPRRLYPGASRVGQALAALTWSPGIRVFNGVDWWGLPSLIGAMRFLLRERPQVVSVQWWTATVAHSYIVLTIWARLLGARVILEYHESQDPGEATIPGAAVYARCALRLLRALSAAFVVHTPQDRELLAQAHPTDGRPVSVIPHGPYDQYTEASEPIRHAPDGVVNILFFGLIRPYKGLGDLLAAFEALDDDEAQGYWLTIVGEAWEGTGDVLASALTHRHRDRITVINRYVHDDEVGGLFDGADAVALPYRRSSGSGPLHIAMSVGRPVIITAVGGLSEAANGYEGAIVVPPATPVELSRALRELPRFVGRRYKDVQSWGNTTKSYADLIEHRLVRQ